MRWREGGGWESVKEVAVKAEAGRRGLELALEMGLELEADETLGFGETGRVLWKGLPLGPTAWVPFRMPSALCSPFKAGVRGGERGPLTCNDPTGG